MGEVEPMGWRRIRKRWGWIAVGGAIALAGWFVLESHGEEKFKFLDTYKPLRIYSWHDAVGERCYELIYPNRDRVEVIKAIEQELHSKGWKADGASSPFRSTSKHNELKIWVSHDEATYQAESGPFGSQTVSPLRGTGMLDLNVGEDECIVTVRPTWSWMNTTLTNLRSRLHLR